MAARLSSSEDDLTETHEINVTPFIDVVLVLLIIFMVAAPLATVDVPVDLPAAAVQRRARLDQPVFLTLRDNHSFWIGNRQIEPANLATTLATETQDDKSQRIFLRADRTIPYGDLMEAMNMLRDAGYLKLALVGLEGEARKQ